MARKGVSNSAVARALREMALFLQMSGISFKPLPYERSALIVDALSKPLTRIHAQGGIRALQGLPGLGKGMAERIADMLETGRMASLEAFRRRCPIDIIGLTSVEGVGVRRAETLWRLLHITNLEELRCAAEAGQLRMLPHFGPRTEARILEVLAGCDERKRGRVPVRPNPKRHRRRGPGHA